MNTDLSNRKPSVNLRDTDRLIAELKDFKYIQRSDQEKTVMDIISRKIEIREEFKDVPDEFDDLI